MAVVKVSGGSLGVPSNVPAPTFAAKPIVALPITKNAPPKNIEDYCYYIYGQQKIGKTSFTTAFPDTLHFMFEPGGRPYEIFQITPEELSSWAHVVAYIDELYKQKQEGTLAFKTIAIDTVDLMWQLCQDNCCAAIGVKHPHEANDFGQTYDIIKKTFRNEVVRLSSLGCGVIFLTHEVDKEVETRSGNKYQQIVPSSQKQCNLILGKFCDLTGNYFVTDRGERKLLIRPNSDAEAGNRIKGRFLYTDGTPMQEVPMGASEAEAFNNFRDAFNNKFTKPVPKETQVNKTTLTIKKQGA